jgi:hypothetical protein
MGEIRTLVVSEINTDPPYRETGYAPDAAHLSCLRYFTLTLKGSDSRISTEWQFENLEQRQGQPIADQRLTLKVTTSVIGQVDSPFPPPYNFALENLSDPFNVSVDSLNIAHTYYPALTIDGVPYTDVLEASIQRNDGRYMPLFLPEADWVRIVIARGTGLIQYELRNGQIFTRM